MNEIELQPFDDFLLAGDSITLQGTDEAEDAMPTPEEAEVQALEEVTEVLKGFKDRAKREDQRFTDATDSEYWVAVCFQTREQKEEFLRKAGWIDLGDKYLDGMLVAEAMKIRLDSRVPTLPELRTDARLSRLSLNTR